MTRKIARNIAHHNMKKSGMEKINKPVKIEEGYRSLFSLNWRRLAHFVPNLTNKRNPARKGV